MSNEFIRFGFISGEVAPQLYGRSDLEKYDLGLSLAKNWYIDYRGGATTRPGTQFGDYIKDPTLDCKPFPFVFAPDTANTYVVLFGNLWVRFIQNNAYVLEGNKVISGITQAAQGVVTVAAHGYSNGDWLYGSAIVGMTQLNGKLLVVSDMTTNTFKIKDYFGNYIDTSGFDAYTSGGATNRVYTVVSPYSSTDLADLHSSQLRDTLRLTHKKFLIYDLIRNDHTDWVLSPTVISNAVPAPTGVTADASRFVSSPPGASCAYAVTAVDHDDNESVASDYAFLIDALSITITVATYRCDWNAQSDIAHFNVYRTIIREASSEAIGRAAEVGYVGRSYGTTFYDQNIIPDFTKTPPVDVNPFVNRKVKWINVLTGGAGYTNNSLVTITSGTGSGFVGFPIVQLGFGDTSGPLVGIVVINGGKDYRGTDTVNVSIGSGATFELSLSQASGNYPSVSAVFQQRFVYAATINDPQDLWGSKPGKFNNFDVASIVLESDSYNHNIDASIVAPIKHLVPVRGGLLVLSQIGIWILSGENGAALTPSNPLAEPQAYTGCADVVPVKIGVDVLYMETNGRAARLLSYKDFYKIYGGEDISILSSHFFNKRQLVENMTYASAPHKVVWCQRNDGSMLSFTLLREQNLYAWTQNWTRGYFRNVLSIDEAGINSTYVIVDRTLNGQKVKTFEKFADNDFEIVEDAWCVDCGLSLPVIYPNATIQVAVKEGTNILVTSLDNAVFTLGDVGKVIRASGGKMTIVSFTNGHRVRVDIIRPCDKLVPFDESETPLEAASGSWTMDQPQTEVSGFDHLSNEAISMLADGNVIYGTVSAEGKITGLPNVTRLVGGLRYDCDLRTLPLSSQQMQIEGSKKRTPKVGINQYQSRGLQVGASFDRLFDVKDRRNEIMGEPIELQDGFQWQAVADKWTVGSGACIRQSQPLPATIRALILDTEIGSDTH